ncbi:MAG: hypothetical protein AAGL24_08435 [Pseudomonadota bacterium]
MSRSPLFLGLAVAGLALVYALPAHASDARAAVVEWLDSMKGGTEFVFDYDGVRDGPDADRVTVEDYSFEWRPIFPGTNGNLRVKATIAELHLDGFEKTAGGYRVKRYAIPGSYEITMTGGSGDLAGVVTVGTISGVTSNNVFIPTYVHPQEDPKRPVSRFVDLIKEQLKVTADSTTVDRILVVQTRDGVTLSEMEYGHYDIKGIGNGRVEEMRLDSYRQTQFPQKSKDPGAPDPGIDRLDVRYGAMVQRGIDIAPMLDWMTGGGTAGGANHRVAIAETTVSDISATVGPFRATADTYSVLGVKFGAGTQSLVNLLDRAVLGETVNEEEAAALAVQMARGMALDEWLTEGLAFDGPAGLRGRADRMRLRDVSNEGLGELSFAGIDFNSAGGETVRLGHAAIGKVIFPDLDAIVRAVKQGAPQDPFEAANLGPKIGAFEVSDLFVDTRQQPPLSLGLYRLQQSGFIGAVPTSLQMKLEALDLPVALIQDPVTRDVLTAIGKNVLKLAGDLSLSWNETSQDLTLHTLDLSMQEGANLSFKAGLSGLPKAALQNTEALQQAIATVTVNNADLSVRDAPVVTALIEHFAKASNLSPEAMRAELLRGVSQAAGPLQSTIFFQEAQAALGAFMAQPGSLTVGIAPAAPVPLTQILGLAATAPQQIPTALGATVTAN